MPPSLLHSRHLLWIAGFFLLAGCGLYLAFTDLPTPLRLLLGRQPPPLPLPSGATAPSPEWQKRTVCGLTFEAPFPLTPAADVTGKLPAAVREIIAATETYEGRDARRDLKASVIRVEYRPKVPLSLDGAAREAINNAAAAIGDAHPSFNIAPTQVSGSDARRTEYHRHVAGGELYLAGVLVLREHELWEVQISSSSEKTAPEVNRLLSTIELAPAAEPAP